MGNRRRKRKNEGKHDKPEQSPKPQSSWLHKIPWRHPGVVGPIAAAIATGLFGIALYLMKADAPAGASTVNPEITVAPQNRIENKPKNVFTPSMTVGLDEEGVGEEVGKRVDPLRQDVAAIGRQFEALAEQLTATQLAPRQPPSDSHDPLKVKAVEFFNAGVDAQEAGNIGQAIGHYLDSLAFDPDLAAHNNLGIAFFRKGDLDGAVEHFEEALRIDPNDADSHSNLGLALRSKGDRDGAIEHLDAALQIDPDSADAHSNLGLVLRSKGDLDGAVEHLDEALRIDPDHVAGHVNLSRTLWANSPLKITGLRSAVCRCCVRRAKAC